MFFDNDVITAIYEAVKDGANIISLSMGRPDSPPYNPEFEKALKYARDNGVPIFAAAGNSRGNVAYPAVSEHTIVVTAVDENKQLYENANMGPKIALAAPGVHVTAPNIYGCYHDNSGTSVANAFAVGLAGKYWKTFRKLSDKDMVELIQLVASISHDLGAPGRDPLFGYGLAVAPPIAFYTNPPVAGQPLDIYVLTVKPFTNVGYAYGLDGTGEGPKINGLPLDLLNPNILGTTFSYNPHVAVFRCPIPNGAGGVHVHVQAGSYDLNAGKIENFEKTNVIDSQ